MSAQELSVPAVEVEWREPLLLRVSHLTRFQYQGEATNSVNEARLQPMDDEHTQQCQDFRLRVVPEEAEKTMWSYPDSYGNIVHWFELQTPHQFMEVEAISLVQTRPDERPIPEENPPEALEDHALMEVFYHFMHDSAFVSQEEGIWRETLDALPGGVTNLWKDTLTMGRHVYEQFAYTPSLTTVNTKPAEVLKLRKGVCQDFAHVLLGMCRKVGIPARYVSGYFFNPNRKPGELEASHAWIEVYLPGYGWKGFDPTHNRVPDTRYVKLAVGRDYKDIYPLGGSFWSRHGTREMSVEVHVTRE